MDIAKPPAILGVGTAHGKCAGCGEHHAHESEPAPYNPTRCICACCELVRRRGVLFPAESNFEWED